jgi:hypothetical protein
MKPSRRRSGILRRASTRAGPLTASSRHSRLPEYPLKKLALNLENLVVTSFETSRTSAGRGTVVGNGPTNGNTCAGTSAFSCAGTCDISCTPSCISTCDAAPCFSVEETCLC